MNLTIPLYIQQRPQENSPAPVFTVRPVFFGEPVRHGEVLSRVIARLAQDLRKLLDRLAREPRQDELARWTFSPELAEHRIRCALALRRQTAQVSLLAVAFESGKQRLAFFPEIDGLWFQVPPGEAVASRARQVLSEHLLKLEKEDDNLDLSKMFRDTARSWLSSIDIDVQPSPRLPKPESDVPFLFLGSAETMSGREELQKVGRCLDWLYPDELERVVLRDAEVEELTRRLASSDRRPLLLLGPRSAGKTAIIHECVWRRVEKSANPHARENNVWLLAPQRLISGMSYVGQWENRLLAILKESRKRDHILYFDDLLGLYAAGMTSQSSLNVAEVMQPYIERREVRVLAEMTPEAFRVLQERDRAMADLFHVLPIRPTGEQQTRSILISVMRQFEAQHRCRFELDVLSMALDLQQRYVPDLAFPGKAAGFLRQLALKHRATPITRATALDEFRARSGLSVAFLDSTARLARKDVLEQIGGNIIGQTPAVEAMADAICIAKARLNDTTRPLATLLFLGPTGVGKTQCAKALAAYLFGDEQRLVRFDMNEFVDPSATSRLVGTFHEPEGLLTGAIRRQPFSVVLLDEIEKADSAVFDLLLQVLGEGRLTDARGRTANFTNAIVIMTSNLGSREAASSFGLRPADHSDADVYRVAVERFFRPEFFNRIDRIVPFKRLSREHIAQIANRLIRALFQREGLVNRRCILQVDPAALEKIVDAGYHPALGARAMKREVERQISAPVARRLASMPAGTPTVISIHPALSGVAVHVQPLTNAPPLHDNRVEVKNVADFLDRCEQVLERIEQAIGPLDPGNHLTQGELSPAHFRYLAIREQAGRVRSLIGWTDEAMSRNRSRPNLQHPMKRARSVMRNPYRFLGPDLWQQLIDTEQAEGIADLIPEPSPDPPEEMMTRSAELQDELALLEALCGEPCADRVLILLRPLGEDSAMMPGLRGGYASMFERQYGAQIHELTEPAMRRLLPAGCDLLLAEMPSAQHILAGEEGTHLMMTAQSQIVPVQVMLIPLAADQEVLPALTAHVERSSCFRSALANCKAAPSEDPFRLRTVIRIYEEPGATADLRTGLAIRGFPTPQELRRFVLAALSLPPELRE